jgi:predicted metal-binding membrane protein
MMTAGWVPMMAAMMLPSALPAIARRVRDRDGVLAAPLFAGSHPSSGRSWAWRSTRCINRLVTLIDVPLAVALALI